jgi:hypothetical protein
MTESACLFKILVSSRPDPYFVEAFYESRSIELMPGVIGPPISLPLSGMRVEDVSGGVTVHDMRKLRESTSGEDWSTYVLFAFFLGLFRGG